MVAVPMLSAVARHPSDGFGSRALLFARSTVQAVTGLLVQSGLPALTYPTSLTRDIVPKSIHSHNDYWRQVPLFDALSYGCKSFEADIHLIDGSDELYVGHKKASLTSSRTLKSLYLDPLEEVLRMQNPINALATNETSGLINGVYDVDPSQSVQFILDYKTNGTSLHPVVLSYLQHYRDLELLTTYDATTQSLTVRPVTVVCSGNCPIELVQAQQPRDVFIDGPLLNLASVDYGSEVAPLASVSFRKLFGWAGVYDLTADRVETVRSLVATAHAKGITVRFWETPSWPAFVRDHVWTTLLQNGVDWINADNLHAASRI
ncbi:SPOSA6832_04389 [Sporobolomyces salmonicolor]|uniref:Altered inheritance of mitochondria protein 6 n=1 Tax=Sporidiobolus salmonicolor TaxID=5005 RepID=A0A0D6ER24_SPOSA|nr:SPOSA6832_04389 [Sporobolomyces salmonicolor]